MEISYTVPLPGKKVLSYYVVCLGTRKTFCCAIVLCSLPGNQKKSPKPFPKGQILDSSKLKEFADDNSKFDENCGKFSKWVENTVGNGEIARYEQFLLFPQCFQMTCAADT